MKRRVMTILGTRPEIIRLSSLIKSLDEHFDHRVIHTGQNSSKELRDNFFQDLDLRYPDSVSEVKNPAGLGEQLAQIFRFVDHEIQVFEPEAVVVLGDTNSGLGALLAKRRNIVVYHLEAGNRSFDENVPEEVNRRIIDHFADFNIVYNQRSFQHLVAEGLSPRRIMMSGSPMPEVISKIKGKVLASSAIQSLGLEEKKYILASFHRQENIDAQNRLDELIRALDMTSNSIGLPVLVSEHPRTRQRLEALRGTAIDLDNFVFHPPFGYADYLALQQSAYVTVSDSGTVAEESAILGFAAVTNRDSMERPEALDAGSIVMSGIGTADILSAIRLARKTSPRLNVDGYNTPDFSARVTRFILSTLGRSKSWHGIHEHS